MRNLIFSEIIPEFLSQAEHYWARYREMTLKVHWKRYGKTKKAVRGLNTDTFELETGRHGKVEPTSEEKPSASM